MCTVGAFSQGFAILGFHQFQTFAAYLENLRPLLCAVIDG
jgi:hypothetical protein